MNLNQQIIKYTILKVCLKKKTQSTTALYEQLAKFKQRQNYSALQQVFSIEYHI